METDTKDLGSKDSGSKDLEETEDQEKKGWPKVIIPKDPSLYPGFPDTEGKNLSIIGPVLTKGCIKVHIPADDCGPVSSLAFIT